MRHNDISGQDLSTSSNMGGLRPSSDQDVYVLEPAAEKLQEGLRQIQPNCGRGVGGTVDSEPALRSAGTLLSNVRVPPPASWRDGKPKSRRSLFCGQAIMSKKRNLFSAVRKSLREPH
ncbi:hypothetical protein PoB_007530700 [Plakobranchus ocellatus]|uniref:Uncharacterized protein n=1 Tax=Plakobranchus ocellatus TaxID=259542 RepID=A0AAV4DXQ1_9GAST|nr:hypothetical protein PoB_007530700 [Plakobranchus ocellatus]